MTDAELHKMVWTHWATSLPRRTSLRRGAGRREATGRG